MPTPTQKQEDAKRAAEKAAKETDARRAKEVAAVEQHNVGPLPSDQAPGRGDGSVRDREGAAVRDNRETGREGAAVRDNRDIDNRTVEARNVDPRVGNRDDSRHVDTRGPLSVDDRYRDGGVAPGQVPLNYDPSFDVRRRAGSPDYAGPLSGDERYREALGANAGPLTDAGYRAGDAGYRAGVVDPAGPVPNAWPGPGQVDSRYHEEVAQYRERVARGEEVNQKTSELLGAPDPTGPVFDAKDREWVANCAERLMLARVQHSGAREIPVGRPQCENAAKQTVALAVALRTAMLKQTSRDYRPDSEAP